MIINNLQHQRKKQESFVPYLMEQFPGARIVVSHHGWIVLSSDTGLGVVKFFSDPSVWQHELSSYTRLQKGGVLIPKIYDTGISVIGGLELSFIRMENIRISCPRITDIQLLKPMDIAHILSSIHAIDTRGTECYIHGNIHPSNFFQNDRGNIGIFDLSGMLYGAREYDFALLYIHADFDDIFLNLVLSSYNERNLFSYKVFYGYVILILVSKIRLRQPIRREGIIGLKLALREVTKKYQSL